MKIIDIYYPLLLRAFRLNGASLECLDEHLDLEMKQSKNKNSGIFKDKNVLKLYRKQNKTSEIFKNVMKMTIIGSLTVLICVFPFFIFELVPIILICVFFFSMFEQVVVFPIVYCDQLIRLDALIGRSKN